MWQHLPYTTLCKEAFRSRRQHLFTCSEQSRGHSSLLHSAWPLPLPALAVTEGELDLGSSGLAKMCTSNVSGFWLLLLSAIQLIQTPQSFKRNSGCKLILKLGLPLRNEASKSNAEWNRRSKWQATQHRNLDFKYHVCTSVNCLKKKKFLPSFSPSKHSALLAPRAVCKTLQAVCSLLTDSFSKARAALVT